MAKVVRRIIRDGHVYEVTCAVRADGVTSPVSDFLDQLKEQTWQPDTADPPELTGDDQYRAYAWLLEAVRYFADNGEFHQRGSWNQLLDGIWEIKRWQLRITFFDTDGLGNYTPKMTERSSASGICPLPDFDEHIRLGTAFEKPASQKKTPQHQLDLAHDVREEDLSHDRQT